MQVLKTEMRAEEAESLSKAARAELEEAAQKLAKAEREVARLAQANEQLKREADEARRDLLDEGGMSDSSSEDEDSDRPGAPKLTRLRLPGQNSAGD